MLGNFFRRSNDYKQRGNEKQLLSHAKAKGNTRSTLTSLGLRLKQHCQFLALGYFVVFFFFEKEILIATDTAINTDHKLSKNVYLGNIHSVVQ